MIASLLCVNHCLFLAATPGEHHYYAPATVQERTISEFQSYQPRPPSKAVRVLGKVATQRRSPAQAITLLYSYI